MVRQKGIPKKLGESTTDKTILPTPWEGRQFLDTEATSGSTNIKRCKNRRYRPGTLALREIRKYQSTTQNLIPRAPFGRFVKEIIQELAPPDTRCQSSVLEILQEACESYLVERFRKASSACIHAKRTTLLACDMQYINADM